MKTPEQMSDREITAHYLTAQTPAEVAKYGREADRRNLALPMRSHIARWMVGR